MKRFAAVLAITALVGCAQSVEHLQSTVGNASNFKLCRAAFLAPNDVAMIARAEAGRRGLDCAPYASAVFQNEAQANAARNALAQQLLTRPAPIIQPSQSLNCQTFRVGNTLQTNCN